MPIARLITCAFCGSDIGLDRFEGKKPEIYCDQECLEKGIINERQSVEAFAPSGSPNASEQAPSQLQKAEKEVDKHTKER